MKKTILFWGIMFLIGLSYGVITRGDPQDVTPTIKYVYVNLTSPPELILQERNVTVEKVIYVDREIIKNKTVIQTNFIKPTKAELKELVMDSHVSGKAYNNKTYDCTEYSNGLIAYLKGEGIFACTTEVSFKNDIGHMVVATELEDGRLMYIEPQKAMLIESKYLNIGDEYCKKIDLNCSFDDEIIKISSCYGLQVKE